jgi:hypothetical protein
MFRIKTFAGKEYITLYNKDAVEAGVLRPRSDTATRVLKWVAVVLALLLVGFAGFLTGQRSATESWSLQCGYLKTQRNAKSLTLW